MSFDSQWETLDIKIAGKSSPYWVEGEEGGMSQQKKIRNDQNDRITWSGHQNTLYKYIQ